MPIHFRQMKHEDIPKCVAGIAAHPVLGPRYGNLIKDLPSALRRVFGLDSFLGGVFEEIQGPTNRFIGAGLSMFVTDDFLQKFKTTPFF